jgi:hypothetical protein
MLKMGKIIVADIYDNAHMNTYNLTVPVKPFEYKISNLHELSFK